MEKSRIKYSLHAAQLQFKNNNTCASIKIDKYWKLINIENVENIENIDKYWKLFNMVCNLFGNCTSLSSSFYYAFEFEV